MKSYKDGSGVGLSALTDEGWFKVMENYANRDQTFIQMIWIN